MTGRFDLSHLTLPELRALAGTVRAAIVAALRAHPPTRKDLTMTTKNDLIAHLAKEHGLTQTCAREVVETMLAFITERAEAGERVALKGFGSFEMRDTKARMGRNPKTGEAVAIPAASRMAFRAAKKAGA